MISKKVYAQAEKTIDKKYRQLAKIKILKADLSNGITQDSLKYDVSNSVFIASVVLFLLNLFVAMPISLANEVSILPACIGLGAFAVSGTIYGIKSHKANNSLKDKRSKLSYLQTKESNYKDKIQQCKEITKAYTVQSYQRYSDKNSNIQIFPHFNTKTTDDNELTM